MVLKRQRIIATIRPSPMTIKKHTKVSLTVIPICRNMVPSDASSIKHFTILVGLLKIKASIISKRVSNSQLNMKIKASRILIVITRRFEFLM